MDFPLGTPRALAVAAVVGREFSIPLISAVTNQKIKTLEP